MKICISKRTLFPGSFSVFILITFVLLNACKKPDKELVDPKSTITKPPLKFDVSALHPPKPEVLNSLMKRQNPVGGLTSGARTLTESGATYYTYSIGNGISSADYTLEHSSHGYGAIVNFTAPGNLFLEATYSHRLASNPESLWIPNGLWLQSGLLRDNEQAEEHFIWTRLPGSLYRYTVYMEYEVSSEKSYDYLWICSTSSDGSCNSPGVVRKKVSGQDSGWIAFEIDSQNCSFAWVGIYYIKDYSVSNYGDYARVKNIMIFEHA